jgi:hypothetical protein
VNPRHLLSDLFTGSSFLAILTAHQEQAEWWLRCGAYAIAILSGLIAIYFRFWPRKKAPLDGQD